MTSFGKAHGHRERRRAPLRTSIPLSQCQFARARSVARLNKGRRTGATVRRLYWRDERGELHLPSKRLNFKLAPEVLRLSSQFITSNCWPCTLRSRPPLPTVQKAQTQGTTMFAWRQGSAVGPAPEAASPKASEAKAVERSVRPVPCAVLLMLTGVIERQEVKVQRIPRLMEPLRVTSANL
jgi:hypothetical protein